jgi:hypothetical protein
MIHEVVHFQKLHGLYHPPHNDLGTGRYIEIGKEQKQALAVAVPQLNSLP